MSAALLAAGSARRMGAEKLLLSLCGEPIVRRVAREIVAVGFSQILVVANAANESVVSAALSDMPVELVVNREAAAGMGGSIAAAVAAVAPTSQALVLAQGDQPFVDRGMLRTLLAEWRRTSPAFVASSYGGLLTTPVVFAARLLGELRALEGDRGARGVLRRHEADGRVIAFPAWQGTDVDTPDDYERAREIAESLRRR